jgi:ribosomal protein S12
MAANPQRSREVDMTNFIKAAGLAGILVVGLAAVPELKADQPNNAVREGRAVTTELSGNAAAVTYWVSKSDGWHVVTTVDTVIGRNGEAEQHAIVRFSSVLLPGQSQSISVPFAIGERQQVLRIRRLRDQVEVTRVDGSA